MNTLTDAFKERIRTEVIHRDAPDSPVIQRLGQRFAGGWLFDFRSVLLNAEWLDTYARIFWERYGAQYPFQVGSIETAGIGLVAAIVMKGKERGTPVNGFFIRKSRKKDGLMKAIEGSLDEHPIILVDDLINTGTSTMKQVLALADAGRAVEEIFTIVAFRPLEAYKPISQHGARVSWLYTLGEFGLSLAEDASPTYDSFARVWKFKGPHASLQHVVEKSAPTLFDDTIVVGTDSGTLFAISQADGTERWRFSTRPDSQEKGIFSTPALYDNKVFFGSYDGNFYALDAGNGSLLWTYHRADWIGSSPAIAKEHRLVFVGLEFAAPGAHGALVALNADTGEEVWSSEFNEFVHCSPHYIDSLGIVLCGDNGGTVRALDAATGSVKWEVHTGGAVKASFAHDPKRGLVFFGSFDGHLYAVNAWSGHIAFSFKTGEPIFSTPLVKNGTVYIASLDKRIYAIDSATGAERWRFETQGRIFASPVLAFNAVWIGSNDACLYELDPETGVPRSVQRFSERIVNAVAPDEGTGHIYVPTVANEIYCLKVTRDTQ